MHDSAMVISRSLSLHTSYNVRLKKDFVIRKLLAELIASKITINLTNESSRTKCRMIFDQCYKVIMRKHLKSTPQKLFVRSLRNTRLIDLYRDSAQEFYSGISKPAYDVYIDNSFQIDWFMFFCMCGLVILILISYWKKKNNKAEFVLLTWYYICKDNYIPEEVICSFISGKFAASFKSYIQECNFAEIQKKYTDR